MNNNKFDWNRFCKVVYKDFCNVWPTFGTTLLIITALPVALWLLLLVIDVRNTAIIEPVYRLAAVVSLPMLASIMTPSRLYRTVNLRGEGIYFAMLPASKLEKFLSILLYTLIVCPLFVLVGGLLLDVLLWLLPFGSYEDSIFSADIMRWVDIPMDSDLPDGTGAILIIASVFGNISNSMLFLFTSTIFRRHKVLQTILWLWLVGFVLSLVMMPVTLHLFQSDSFMQWAENIVDGDFDEVRLFYWCSVVTMVVSIVFAVLFGWLSWRRIKKMAY